MSETSESTLRWDAAKAAAGMVLCIFAVFFSGQQAGFIQSSLLGHGIWIDAAVVSVAALVGAGAFGILLGIVLAGFIKWRYSHVTELVPGGDS